jgi:transcriptional repressor NrdR
MRCPFCRVDNDKVVDSRASEDGYSIRRRRLCLNCRRRYTTRERLGEDVVQVVKKDGIREPFDPEKIRRGLERACYKRPISNEQIEAIVSAVGFEVQSNFDAEVQSRHLGDIVMDKLRDLDHVAFVRFASVYREFKDVQDFVHEIEPILRANSDH